MPYDIRYDFTVSRGADSFTLNANYFIQGTYDPWGGFHGETHWRFRYETPNGNLLDGSSGFAGQSASVQDSFDFDTGPGVAIRYLTFEAHNEYDGYGFGFDWVVFDAALETQAKTIDATNNTDIVFGGSGDDTIRGYGEADWLDGGAGADRMYGGSGSDTYVVDNSGDRLFETGAGIDSVLSSVSFVLGAGLDDLKLTGGADIDATGNGLSNLIIGNAGDNAITGGGAADALFGAGGSDSFVYRQVSDSVFPIAGRDIIRDFSKAQSDEIDLQRVDANNRAAGNQAFDFIGRAQFDGTAGELRFDQVGGKTIVLGDTNGDSRADFAIDLTGRITLRASDFDM